MTENKRPKPQNKNASLEAINSCMSLMLAIPYEPLIPDHLHSFCRHIFITSSTISSCCLETIENVNNACYCGNGNYGNKKHDVHAGENINYIQTTHNNKVNTNSTINNYLTS